MTSKVAQLCHKYRLDCTLCIKHMRWDGIGWDGIRKLMSADF